MALKGCDISGYQSSTPSGYDFYIIKASEGTKGNWTLCSMHRSNVKKMGKLIGFYHFGRPDLGNSAQVEADAFLATVGSDLHNAVLALDLECKHWENYVEWTRTWLTYIYQKTGVRPLLYIEGWAANRFVQMCKDTNTGVWSCSSDSYYAGMTIVIKQRVYDNLDHDTFNGDSNTWNKYANPSGSAAKPTPAPTPAPQPKPAQTSGFHVGDTVIPTVLRDVHGNSLKQWDKAYTITSINGSNATLSARGQIWAVLPFSNIRKTGSAPAQAVASQPSSAITVGCNVRIRNGAKTYTGGSLASFVYGRVHQVSEIKCDRAVITYGGQVVAAVHVSDLTRA